MIEFFTLGLTIALAVTFAIAPRRKLGEIALILLPLWLGGVVLAFQDIPSGQRWSTLAMSPVGAVVFVPMLPLLRLFRSRT
jgi:hypothetical protein